MWPASWIKWFMYCCVDGPEGEQPLAPAQSRMGYFGAIYIWTWLFWNSLWNNLLWKRYSISCCSIMSNMTHTPDTVHGTTLFSLLDYGSDQGLAWEWVGSSLPQRREPLSVCIAIGGRRANEGWQLQLLFSHFIHPYFWDPTFLTSGLTVCPGWSQTCSYRCGTWQVVVAAWALAQGMQQGLDPPLSHAPCQSQSHQYCML